MYDGDAASSTACSRRWSLLSESKVSTAGDFFCLLSLAVWL